MLNDTAIHVENLGKMYRIGRAVCRSENVPTAIKKTLAAPFRYTRDMLRHHRYMRTMRGAGLTIAESRFSENEPNDYVWALRNVSFDVKRGEVIGIIGRNGAGKSTLLKLLSRITDPTTGCAVINGRVNSLLEVGTGFHAELTGRENIYMAAALHGMKKAEIDRKFDEIVDFAGIGKFIDTPVKRYSSGMSVRLGFAVAANLEPDVLIVDEVLAVGDYNFQEKCLGKMKDATRRSGVTVLFVSHNMAAVSSLCRQSIWLENGRVKELGATATIVESYLNQYAKETAIYQVDGRTVHKGSYARLVSISVTNNQGEVQQVYGCNEAIHVEVVLDVLRDDVRLLNVLYLRRMDNECIFIVNSGKYSEHMSIGLTRVCYTIPPHILNEGKYKFDYTLKYGGIAVGNNAITVRDAVFFSVNFNEENSESWFGEYPGTIRPDWTWSILKINDIQINMRKP